MADEKIQLDITAKDDASKTIDKVADAAEDLEKLEPELTVTADTDTALADVNAVGDAARALDQADAELVIRAKIDAAKADLSALETQLHGLDDAAVSTGSKIGDEIEKGTGAASSATHSMAGNVIGDASAMATGFGPLGEAIGQMTEGILAGEVGFKDLVTAGAGMAALALVAKTVTDALAATKAVDAFNKKKVDDFTKALREGKTMLESLNDELESTGKIEFVDQVSGATKDLVGTLSDAGITWDVFSQKIAGGKQAFSDWVIASGPAIGAGETLNDVINAGNQFVDDRIAADKAWTDQLFVMGVTASETDRETRKLNASVDAGTDSIDHSTAASKSATTQMSRFREQTALADEKYRRLIGALDEQDAWAAVIADIQTYNENTKHSEEETRAHIRAIADYVATTDTIPESKKTEILTELNAGDVAAAEATLDELTKTRDLKILLTAVGSADTIKLLRSIGRGGTGIVDEATTSAASVTINMPRGSRGVDVVRQISGSARRSGRRYGAPVVTHASR